MSADVYAYSNNHSNTINFEQLYFQTLLEGLPQNIWIVDSFQKANSVVNNNKYQKIICAVSGGSDSDILVDMMTKIDIYGKVEYVFYNTGLEYFATQEHLKYLEERYNIKIIRMRSQTPVPAACKIAGQPFLNKWVSECIHRLQSHSFRWEDKPFEELYLEYPKCKSALQWWCNMKGEKSMFNICNNKWLKEFMVQNPPTFKISKQCCNLAKEGNTAGIDYDLNVVGVRKAEGGLRAGINKCITYGEQQDTYRPLYWYNQEAKSEYEAYAEIEHSRCYTEYGLKRTGCAGCPFGRNCEKELEILEIYEPNLYKAVNNVFKDSYEYTRRYKEFCRQMDEGKAQTEKTLKDDRYGHQMSIFDFM